METYILYRVASSRPSFFLYRPQLLCPTWLPFIGILKSDDLNFYFSWSLGNILKNVGSDVPINSNKIVLIYQLTLIKDRPPFPPYKRDSVIRIPDWLHYLRISLLLQTDSFIPERVPLPFIRGSELLGWNFMRRPKGHRYPFGAAWQWPPSFPRTSEIPSSEGDWDNSITENFTEFVGPVSLRLQTQ